MKKLLTTAFLSLAALALGSNHASAWWPMSCCKSKCCISVCARQYNAFSPYCIDGCGPCGAIGFSCGTGCAQGACAYGGANLGELPMTMEAGSSGVAHVTSPGMPVQNGNGQYFVNQPQANGQYYQMQPQPNGQYFQTQPQPNGQYFAGQPQQNGYEQMPAGYAYPTNPNFYPSAPAGR
jgi:hypothetical protein